MAFVIFYLVLIIIAAKAINIISVYWPGEEGNWAIITPDAYFPGFPKERKARQYAREREWTVFEIVKLKDL